MAGMRVVLIVVTLCGSGVDVDGDAQTAPPARAVRRRLLRARRSVSDHLHCVAMNST
jgi:hypothetical protein